MRSYAKCAGVQRVEDARESGSAIQIKTNLEPFAGIYSVVWSGRTAVKRELTNRYKVRFQHFGGWQIMRCRGLVETCSGSLCYAREAEQRVIVEINPRNSREDGTRIMKCEIDLAGLGAGNHDIQVQITAVMAVVGKGFELIYVCGVERQAQYGKRATKNQTE